MNYNGKMGYYGSIQSIFLQQVLQEELRQNDYTYHVLRLTHEYESCQALAAAYAATGSLSQGESTALSSFFLRDTYTCLHIHWCGAWKKKYTSFPKDEIPVFGGKIKGDASGSSCDNGQHHILSEYSRCNCQKVYALCV